MHGVSGRWRKLYAASTADVLSQTLAGPELPCDLFRSAGAAAGFSVAPAEPVRSGHEVRLEHGGQVRGRRIEACPVD